MTPTERFRDALVRAQPMPLNTAELRRAFLELLVYSHSRPTGVVDWKLWRAEVAPGVWHLCGYLPHDAAHSRATSTLALLLPDSATVAHEQGGIVLRHRGREFYYGFRGVPIALIQGDAWTLDAEACRAAVQRPRRSR